MILPVCLSQSQCILTPMQLPQGQKVCCYNFLAVGECAFKIDSVCVPMSVCLPVCVYRIVCAHVCIITYCLRGQRVQLRLPLCGVCGARRWERNKSNIDCRAGVPPAGDSQTCRPGSKCFSPPKLAWEATGAAELHPQHWDCLWPNDSAGEWHTHTQRQRCAHTHWNSHTIILRLI